MDLPHVVIGIPNKGFVATEMLNFIPANLKKKIARISLSCPDSTPHDSTRNAIVKDFLSNETATHLLWVDSDVVIPDDTFERLLAHDKDIIAANVKMYMKARNSYAIAAGLKDEDGVSYTHKGLPELLEQAPPVDVDMVGFGCVLMTRRVLETIPKPCFKFKYDEDGVLAKGEDVYFCELAKSHGFSIYLDHTVECVHRKTVDLK